MFCYTPLKAGVDQRGWKEGVGTAYDLGAKDHMWRDSLDSFLSQGKCYFDLSLKKRSQSRPKYINSKNRMRKSFLQGVGVFFFSTV